MEARVPIYIVRIKVGFFNAPNLRRLMIMVDECTDPGSCEYQPMPDGGIMWTSPAIPVPVPEPENEDPSEPDPIPWSEATANRAVVECHPGVRQSGPAGVC